MHDEKAIITASESLSEELNNEIKDFQKSLQDEFVVIYQRIKDKGDEFLDKATKENEGEAVLVYLGSIASVFSEFISCVPMLFLHDPENWVKYVHMRSFEEIIKNKRAIEMAEKSEVEKE